MTCSIIVPGSGLTTSFHQQSPNTALYFPIQPCKPALPPFFKWPLPQFLLGWCDHGLILTFILTRMVLSSMVFRVWSILAGWDCSKTCQRGHLNLPPSTTREPCTKPGRSASMYERSSFKWGTSHQHSSSLWIQRSLTDAWTVTVAARWRSQRKWDSTWRLQPLTTGMILKRLKRPRTGGTFLFFYLKHSDSKMSLLWPSLNCQEPHLT